VEVKTRLPLLQQKKYYKNTKYGYARGEEPIHYVDNIRRYYDTLSWLDDQAKEQAIALKLEQEKLQAALMNEALIDGTLINEQVVSESSEQAISQQNPTEIILKESEKKAEAVQ
jgi:membrane-bound lytic murein transglycosylase F